MTLIFDLDWRLEELLVFLWDDWASVSMPYPLWCYEGMCHHCCFHLKKMLTDFNAIFFLPLRHEPPNKPCTNTAHFHFFVRISDTNQIKGCTPQSFLESTIWLQKLISHKFPPNYHSQKMPNKSVCTWLEKTHIYQTKTTRAQIQTNVLAHGKKIQIIPRQQDTKKS